MVKCALQSELTQSETDAAARFASDAGFLHAIHQGWQDELVGRSEYDQFRAGFSKFRTEAKALRDDLDSAIGKSALEKAAVVYSGHGRGYSTLGSINGEPEKLVGLRYQYPGYISTSWNEVTAINSFLAKRQYKGSRPVLLELRIPKGFSARPT
jgi:hypothetical protein